MEFIRVAITQPFLNIETSGLDQKKYIKHFTTLGVIKYISGHLTGHILFFDSKVPIDIFEMVPARHVVTIR